MISNFVNDLYTQELEVMILGSTIRQLAIRVNLKFYYRKNYIVK